MGNLQRGIVAHENLDSDISKLQFESGLIKSDLLVWRYNLHKGSRLHTAHAEHRGIPGITVGWRQDVSRHLPVLTNIRYKYSIKPSWRIALMSPIFVDHDPKLAAARRAETRRNVTAAGRVKRCGARASRRASVARTK